MLTEGTDFSCSSLHNVFVCQAKVPAAATVYSTLQERVRAVASELAKVRGDVPQALTTIALDGRIGPTTALGAQVVLAALNHTVSVPPELMPLLSVQASGDEIIRRVAAQASEILAYIDDVVQNHPEALRAVGTAPAGGFVSPISVKAMLITGGALVALVGIVLVVRKLNEQQSGVVDGSHFLPLSEDDEEEEDVEEDVEDVADAEIVE